jgi:hypothetical protein
MLWDNEVRIAALKKLDVFQDFCNTQEDVS